MICSVYHILLLLLLLISYCAVTLVLADNDCLGVEMLGRTGNLMFEYAALVGICTARGLNYSSCVYIPDSKINLWDLPIGEFLNVFSLPSASQCHLHSVYREKSFAYDPNLLSIRYGTKIQGWLQSYRYFYPHANKIIRDIYSLPAGSQKESAETFIMGIRQQLTPGTRLIGVHVRLGDKVNYTQSDAIYDQWSRSEAYYLKAIRLLTARHKNYALVFFSGGGNTLASLQKDREWTMEHFGNLTNNTFFDTHNNHIPAWYALRLCDSLVVAHSTFSWWAAYLSDSMEIVAPYQLFTTKAARDNGYFPEDYYPDWWTLLAKDSNEDRIVGLNFMR